MQIIQPVDEDMWWEVVGKCDYATFFHTPLWHKLTTQTFPEYKDMTIGVILNDGTRVILPLLEQGKVKSAGRVNVSSFAGCYGDVVSDGSVNFEDRQLIYQYLFSQHIASIQVTDTPIHSLPKPDKKLAESVDFTHILTLNSSFETIFSGFSKGHRSSYNKGVRMGVSVRLAQTLDDYRAYFGAYEDSLRRWGEMATKQYPWALFENGFYLAQNYPENIKLWLAIVEEEVVAGAWVFYWNQHVDWWHGAAYESYFDHSPNNVLQTQIIKDALEKGYRYYDFNPSGGLENVARFKGRFGARKWPLKRWKYESRRLHVRRKISRKMKGILHDGS